MKKCQPGQGKLFWEKLFFMIQKGTVENEFPSNTKKLHSVTKDTLFPGLKLTLLKGDGASKLCKFYSYCREFTHVADISC